jgi:hypothetical protein
MVQGLVLALLQEGIVAGLCRRRDSHILGSALSQYVAPREKQSALRTTMPPVHLPESTGRWFATPVIARARPALATTCACVQEK